MAVVGPCLVCPSHFVRLAFLTALLVLLLRAAERSAAIRSASFSLDLAGAYPPEAKVDPWRRDYAFARSDRYTITDDFVLRVVTAPKQLLLALELGHESIPEQSHKLTRYVLGQLGVK